MVAETETTDPDSRRRVVPRMPLSWIILIAFDLCIVALVCAQESPDGERPQKNETQVIELAGPVGITEKDSQFEAIDVYVDSGADPLAAYQLELASETPGVKIVGIEGGEHTAFSDAPYYDSRAMRNNRVIIAAFSTGKDLPSGRSRVARIHVEIQGAGARSYRTRLSVSATVEGRRIPARVSLARIVI